MYRLYPFVLATFVGLVFLSFLPSSLGLQNNNINTTANQDRHLFLNFTTDSNNNTTTTAYNTTLSKKIQSLLLPAKGEFFATDLNSQRNKYLQSWNNTGFQSGFNTFVEPNSAKGYGMYVKHPSQNIFKKGDIIELYVEPIGFRHKELFDGNGNILYQINITSNVIVFDKQGGNQVQSTTIDHPIINSYNKITEHYITIPLKQETPFPNGDYVIRYFITDGTTGQTFELKKPIKIAEIANVL